MNALARRAIVMSLVLGLAGCMQRTVEWKVHRSPDRIHERLITQYWADEVRARGRAGDWLLTRSFAGLSDFIVAVTPGDNFSHVALYDSATDTVFESVGNFVTEIPLVDFLQRTYHVLLLRPEASEEVLSESVKRARTVVGLRYDRGVAFGFDDPDKLNCGELLLWAIGAPELGWDTSLSVSAPSLMSRHGRALWYSGTRDDAVVRRRAVEHVMLPPRSELPSSGRP